MATTLAVLSVAFVAVTLIFNYVQAREVVRHSTLFTTTNRAVLLQGVTTAMHDISKILLAEPELYRYLYEGAELPVSEPERSKVCILAEMFLDLMSMTLNSECFFSEDYRRSWRQYFLDISVGSPAIRHFWLQNRDWYEPPLWELINDAVVARQSMCTAGAIQTDRLSVPAD